MNFAFFCLAVSNLQVCASTALLWSLLQFLQFVSKQFRNTARGGRSALVQITSWTLVGGMSCIVFVGSDIIAWRSSSFLGLSFDKYTVPTPFHTDTSLLSKYMT